MGYFLSAWSIPSLHMACTESHARQPQRMWASSSWRKPLCGLLAVLGSWWPRTQAAIHTAPRGGRLLGPGTRPPPPLPPPPLPALRANSVAKGQQLLAIHIVAPKAPENFFSFPLHILSALHPNIILEPNLDSNAHPNPQPTPNPTPKPFP